MPHHLMKVKHILFFWEEGLKLFPPEDVSLGARGDLLPRFTFPINPVLSKYCVKL